MLETIVANKKVAILVVAILVVGTTALAQVSNQQPTDVREVQSTTTAQTVSVLSVTDAQNQERIRTNGTVEGRSQAVLTAEAAGTVEQVFVEIGDVVSRGNVLVQLSAADERASVAQAEASLLSQQARLRELRSGARPAELDNAKIGVETAEISLREARSNFLNTDLQAYLVDEDAYTGSGSLIQPTISGVYDADEAGKYYIDLYQSDTQSGYSFRYSGLESGVSAVNTDTPQLLGRRGLFIQFPENFASNHNVEWVVPIPNTRSNQFNQVESSFQRAQQQLRQAKNNLDIAQSGARSEQVQAQEAAVAQAEAGISAAQARLLKKTLRAPFSGEVTSVDVNIGEQVSPGQPMVELVDANRLQITAYVSSKAARSIEVGNTVRISDQYQGEVIAVATAIGQASGKVEVKVRLTDPATDLIVGEFVSLEITTDDSGGSAITVPLTAVKNDMQGAYVLRVTDEGITERVSVETGSIRGDDIVIVSGLDSVSAIISDIRSVTAGESVQIK